MFYRLNQGINELKFLNQNLHKSTKANAKTKKLLLNYKQNFELNQILLTKL